MSVEDFDIVDNETTDNSIIKRFFENLSSTGSKF